MYICVLSININLILNLFAQYAYITFGKKNLKQDELGLVPFAGECSFLIYFNTYPQRFCGDIEHF